MKLLASRQEIDDAIAKMAEKIVQEYGHTQPLFITLLRGAAPFASKLMFEIARQAPDMHPQLDYMMLSSYGEKRTPGSLKVALDLSPKTKVALRTVIVLDDVLDHGVTSSFVADYLYSKEAQEVKLAVLVEKDLDRVNPKHADFACFHSGPEWLTGMGMDDASIGRDANRWLDEIRVLN